jgi:hypothetical protein
MHFTKKKVAIGVAAAQIGAHDWKKPAAPVDLPIASMTTTVTSTSSTAVGITATNPITDEVINVPVYIQPDITKKSILDSLSRWGASAPGRRACQPNSGAAASRLCGGTW